MAIKYRSSLNYLTQYESFKQGYAIGIEHAVFLKRETTAGTFVPPAFGTQGKCTGGTGASTDITGGSATTLQVNLDGSGATSVTLTLTSLDTAAEIAAALETAINAAYAAAGKDARCWVETTGGVGSERYVIHSQKVGTGSSVVVTAGASNDVADTLKLLTTSSPAAVNTAGTNGSDYLFMQKASFKLGQEIEKSKHRSGRQGASIIKKKKTLEGEIETYVCFDTSGGSPAIDDPVALLLESALGRKVVSGSEIRFDMAQPSSVYFSALQCNNVFNKKLNGVYAKALTISLPGDGEASMKFSMAGRDSKESSISQASAAGVSTATWTPNAGEAGRHQVGAVVMIVSDDGRTITAGGDGALTVTATDTVGNTNTLSAAQSWPDNSFLVPWAPNVFAPSAGIDNPVTGLEGSVSFDGGSETIEEIRSAEITIDDKKVDLGEYYGADGNRGFVIGDSAEIMLKVELNISASQYQKVLATKDFGGFDVKIVLGSASGRRLEMRFPKFIPKLAEVEIPDSGTVPVTFEGMALQTVVGALDAVILRYL
jgi:hypothetical protein